MNELDNLVDEIYGAIAKYLTDNLIDIKDVKMGDSVLDNQQVRLKDGLTKMRTRLEMYSRMTLKKGGVWYGFEESVWYRLGEKNGYSVYKMQSVYERRRWMGYTPYRYQIYNADGKRVYESTNYAETMMEFRQLGEE